MNIVGTEFANTLRGTIDDDTIFGLGGDDFIYGSNGNDLIDGGDGDDQLFFRYAGSTVLTPPTGPITYILGPSSLVGSDGVINTTFFNVENVAFNMPGDFAFDVVFDARTFVSVPSPQFLSFYLTGAGNDTIYGSAYDELINAREGLNWVDAGAGFDEVYTYFGTSSEWVYLTGDQTEVLITQGGTTLLTALNAEMVGAGSLTIGTGSRNLDASGLVGVSANLADGAGSDTFIGSRQDDKFAYDTLGTGAVDLYTGNGGADVWDFSYVTATWGGSVITDFHTDDYLDFLDITFFGGSTYSARDAIFVNGDLHYGNLSGYAGELAYHWANGQTIIEHDVDGDGVADQSMVLANGQFILESVFVFTEDFSQSFFEGIRITSQNLDVSLTAGADVFWGGAESDVINGLGGNDVLSGLAGNDRIDGGAGIDTASYASAAAGVVVTLARNGFKQDTRGDGIDTLIGIESLAGSAFDDRLTGNDEVNVITGNAGNDLLFGGGGNDRLDGGLGNDSLSGGIGDDRLYGNEGNDRLDGNAGADIMVGGTGDDLYVFDSIGDEAKEFADGGIDTIRALGVGVNLATMLQVENVIIINGNVDATGNGLANRLTGSDGANTLNGGAGADILKGNGGADTLIGGTGADQLFGGAGVDLLTGGTGWDNFYFTALTDSSTGPAFADRITDFSQADGDHIILAGIDAIAGGADDAFTFIGTAGFSGTAGELRYQFDANHDTVVMMDVDGDGVVDMTIVLTGEINLTGGDFVL